MEDSGVSRGKCFDHEGYAVPNRVTTHSLLSRKPTDQEAWREWGMAMIRCEAEGHRREEPTGVSIGPVWGSIQGGRCQHGLDRRTADRGIHQCFTRILAGIEAIRKADPAAGEVKGGPARESRETSEGGANSTELFPAEIY